VYTNGVESDIQKEHPMNEEQMNEQQMDEQPTHERQLADHEKMQVGNEPLTMAGLAAGVVALEAAEEIAWAALDAERGGSTCPRAHAARVRAAEAFLATREGKKRFHDYFWANLPKHIPNN